MNSHGYLAGKGWREGVDEKGEERDAAWRVESAGGSRRGAEGADCHKFKQQLTFRVGPGSHRTAVYVSVSRFSGRTKSAVGVLCGSVKKMHARGSALARCAEKGNRNGTIGTQRGKTKEEGARYIVWRLQVKLFSQRRP